MPRQLAVRAKAGTFTGDPSHYEDVERGHAPPGRVLITVFRLPQLRGWDMRALVGLEEGVLIRVAVRPPPASEQEAVGPV